MAKKKSIREFVSEEDLKFQLYLLKFSQQLKNLNEKTEEEIINQFNEEIEKRLNLIEKDREKIPTSNQIAHDALSANEQYVKSWEPPLDAVKIHKRFETKRDNYIKYLVNRIAEENRQQDIDMLAYAKDIQLLPKISKEKFGQMLLLMIKNMATMPSFSGYTENWKTDFYSNAIEKTLLYVHNFDEDLLSKRTGDKSKAFAYVTQICFNAFVNVINIRKAESEFIKDTISFNTSNVEGVKQTIIPTSKEEKQEYLKELIIIIENGDDLEKVFKEKFEAVKKSNKQHKENKSISKEIAYLDDTTPEHEKTQDYVDYIEGMRLDIKIPEYSDVIEHLIIQKPKEMSVPEGFNLPKSDFAISIRGPIEPKPKKQKPKVEKSEEELELEEFNEEW